MVANATEPVTLKQLQDQLDLKPGIVSGSLASLCRAGRLSREKIEKTNGNGPKLQWAYKTVAITQQNNVESSVE
jgi:predicted transcriptional regulator